MAVSARVVVGRMARRPLAPVWAYLPLAAFAEILASWLGPEVGLVVQLILVAGLVYRALAAGPGAVRNLLLSVLLVPVGRILILLPLLVAVPHLESELIATVVLAGAVAAVSWRVRLPYQKLGLGSVPTASAIAPFRAPRFQLLIGAGGLGLGLLESTMVRPGLTTIGSGLGASLLEALILIVLTGFLGEFIFRGVVLDTAMSAMRGWGVIYATLLFAALRAGHRSLADLAFACLVGLLFVFVARSTQSILGVAVAHGLASVTLFLLVPALAVEPGLVAVLTKIVLWLGAAAGGIAVATLTWRGTIQPKVQARSLRDIRNRASREDLSRLQRDLVRRSQTLAPSSARTEDWRNPSDGVSGGVTEWSRPLRDAVIQASKRGVATRSSIRAVVQTTAQPIQNLLQSLQETFAGIPDPRSPRGRRQPLPLVLALATYAMLYGAGSVYSVARWLRGHQPELAARTDLGGTKAPSPTTFHRIFTRLDVDAFETALRGWAKTNLPGGEEALVVDDKILRGVHGTRLPGVRLADGFEPPDGLEPKDAETPNHGKPRTNVIGNQPSPLLGGEG